MGAWTAANRTSDP